VEALNVDLYLLPLVKRWELLALRWEARILRLSSEHPLRRHWNVNVEPLLRAAVIGDRADRSRLMGQRRLKSWSLPQRLSEFHRQHNVPPESPALVEQLDCQALPVDPFPALSACLTPPIKRLHG
jgi:hypothetical protein